MTLYTLFYPKREIPVAFFIPMPMWVLLAIYIVMPAASAVRRPTRRGSTWASRWPVRASRYLYKQFDLRWSRLTSGRQLPAPAADLLLGRLRPGHGRESCRPLARPQPASAVAARRPAVSVLPEEQLDARLDEVLAKIARDGNRDGLTEEEQRVLQEASRRARIRRSDRI